MKKINQKKMKKNGNNEENQIEKNEKRIRFQSKIDIN